MERMINLARALDDERLIEKIEQLEEENKKLNIKVASLEWEIKWLNYTIDKPHKELEECECSFWFESDEVWFWKREYKRLKKWIKDHCNGYWNLFPEDEMKRQWKKADKKRK